jgi:hypothetical protein
VNLAGAFLTRCRKDAKRGELFRARATNSSKGAVPADTGGHDLPLHRATDRMGHTVASVFSLSDVILLFL